VNPVQDILFPLFHLDPVNERLWRGSEEIPLRRKTFAVLRYLTERPGQLVTKEALLDAVWPETSVSESVLAVSIRELRKALGDDPQTPQFIETVHGRGYRFIQLIQSLEPAIRSQGTSRAQGPESGSREDRPTVLQFPTPIPQPLTPNFVGRRGELEQLHRWLEKALGGERQIVFVTGEPGIGKTTVVEVFLEQAAAEGGLWIGRGQCIEHYGAGEAYMPVLEAFGRLCREPGGERLIELLGQHAPTWLVQMPALLSTAEREKLQREVQGATRERMLREMAEAVETLTVERPLILRLEDLHWSDVSTLELLSVLARRREWAGLLVIGTYRPVEMLANEHPLRAVKQELQLHHQCEELRLNLLTEGDVAKYLVTRFMGSSLPARLTRVFHQRTEGNPLFIVNMVDYLTARGVLVEIGGQWQLKAAVEEVETGVPESIQQLIEKHIERLSPEEQRVLEVASVAGAEFSAAAVAAGVKVEIGEVEARCARLARRDQFLRTSGMEEWPDGTVSTRYRFLHALYQEVWYERVPVGQRVSLHRWIGEREEQAYREQVREIAVELAMHFERGRDYRRAIQYCGQAGENAIQRSAHVEAIRHLTKALELLKTLPDTPERTRQELTLQTALGVPLVATKGYAAPAAGEAYTRARELCQQVEETPQLFPVLVGLFRFYLVRAEHETARELGEQLLSLAQSVQDPALLLEAHFPLGAILYCLGEFAPAREHLEQSIARYDPQQHSSHALVYGADPGVFCLSWTTHVLWSLGYPDQALKRSQEALALAQELSYSFSLALALDYATILHQFRRERQAAQERAVAAVVLCTEQGFAYYLAWGTFMQGWALAEQGQAEEGIAQMRQSLAALRATGAELRQPYYLAMVAEACGKVGQAEEGLTILAEALARAHRSRECWWKAELYRLKGELLRQKAKIEPEAEECFRQAIDIARRQSAKSLELRAVISLSRLWQKQGKKEQARQLLAEIYNWFTEGFDTADLKEAQVLLEELS
jgi:predicted ATPase/DNA-binding winged helix-turn-helix (wHTH) protein